MGWGNGIGMVAAGLIVAAAIMFNGDLGQKPPGAVPATEEEFAEWYARAVGDIRNDIVVNCGCCGEGGAKPGF